jgi:hypothetical protein
MNSTGVAFAMRRLRSRPRRVPIVPVGAAVWRSATFSRVVFAGLYFLAWAFLEALPKNRG